MSGFTPTREAAILDTEFPTAGATHSIAYSEDGATEFAGLAQTAIGATGWRAADGASPSSKRNANTLTTADATAAGTVSHWAVFDGATQVTDWQVVTDDVGTPVTKTVAIGDKLEWAPDDLEVTLD